MYYIRALQQIAHYTQVPGRDVAFVAVHGVKAAGPPVQGGCRLQIDGHAYPMLIVVSEFLLRVVVAILRRVPHQLHGPHHVLLYVDALLQVACHLVLPWTRGNWQSNTCHTGMLVIAYHGKRVQLGRALLIVLQGPCLVDRDAADLPAQDHSCGAARWLYTGTLNPHAYPSS